MKKAGREGEREERERGGRKREGGGEEEGEGTYSHTA